MTQTHANGHPVLIIAGWVAGTQLERASAAQLLPPAQQPGTEGFQAASSSTNAVTRSGGKKF